MMVRQGLLLPLVTAAVIFFHFCDGFVTITARPVIDASSNAAGFVTGGLSRPNQRFHTDVPLQIPSLTTTARQAVAAGIPTNNYKNQGLRSRLYEKIKERIDRKKRVEDISDIHEFQSLLANERESFVAVMFHSPSCKACQASIPLFHRMARRYPDVKFVSVPLTEYNKDKLKGLGVEKFPFGHVYDPERGLVEKLPILRKLIPHFEARLRSLLSGENEGKD